MCNKKLESGIFLTCVLFTVVGCTTVTLPSGPKAFALVQYPNAVTLGVPKVEDARGVAKMGTIGALSINMDDKVTGFVSDYLINCLNNDLKMNVQRIKDVNAADLTSIAKEYHLDRIVVGKIISLKMFSIDAILQPVETTIVLDITIYNQDGSKIYGNNFLGNNIKRVNALAVQTSAGKLVEEAVKDSMIKVKVDDDFQKALKI